MSGNIFGRIFRITTFGESHGEAVGVVVDGMPPGYDISVDFINDELSKRRPGQSRVTTGRNEEDKVEILSGIFEGKSTGMPIAMIIRNRDVKSEDYLNIRDVFRPGHADYGYYKRYGIRDWRGGGRSSGRETAARVAAGALAKILLKKSGIKVVGYTRKIEKIEIKNIDYDFIDKNILRTPDSSVVDDMLSVIDGAKRRGDSVGGEVEVVVKGVQAGLGDPVFDKLDALLAHAVVSIGAVKSFEVGKGREVAEMYGSEYNDPFYNENGTIRTKTNNAGGILGGISTGEDIIIRAAVRPTASIGIEQKTVDSKGTEKKIVVKGRHDPCIVPRIVPVVEAMVAIVIADCILMKKAIKPYSGEF